MINRLLSIFNNKKSLTNEDKVIYRLIDNKYEKIEFDKDEIKNIIIELNEANFGIKKLDKENLDNDKISMEINNIISSFRYVDIEELKNKIKRYNFFDSNNQKKIIYILNNYTNMEKGAKFEYLVAWIYKLLPNTNYKKVSISGNFNDNGIDITLENTDNSFEYLQCKYRDVFNDNFIPITVNEISKYMRYDNIKIVTSGFFNNAVYNDSNYSIVDRTKFFNMLVLVFPKIMAEIFLEQPLKNNNSCKECGSKIINVSCVNKKEKYLYCTNCHKRVYK